MTNIPMIAKRLKEDIDLFLDTECGGSDVNDQEEEMYQQLRLASDSINEFLSTQKMEHRKFQVGKTYYNSKYQLRSVKKVDNGLVYFRNKSVPEAIRTDDHGNESACEGCIVEA